MKAATHIVILGATGHFGARIARRLAGDNSIQLTVTSRSIESAEALAAALADEHANTNVAAAAIDQDAADFRQKLAALKPDILIHTAGPYQGQDYRVAEACINCGSHYIDLADGRAFVGAFETLNDRAVAQGVFLVSGASTLPGLSSVVIAGLRDRFATITGVETSIAPAHQTPRGAGTVAAVLSYCGMPFDTLVDGDWRQLYGWQHLKRIRYKDLGSRWAAACDVPDLKIFPRQLEGIRTVTFHAALEARWEQLALWVMAAAVRLRIVKDWSRYTTAFQRMSSKLLSLGSDRGGMLMQVDGIDADGEPGTVTWTLTARQNHGPEIPCTPALIIARKLAVGDLKQRGAMPCWNLFDLDDLARELSGFDIEWRYEEQT